MRLFTTIAALRCYLDIDRAGDIQLTPYPSDVQNSLSHKTIGLVPTMGALHQGHLSLIERARQENEIVVVSVFVNPLQFGPNEDYQNYPRTWERDRDMCEQAGVDVIFMPNTKQMGIVFAELGTTGHRLTQVVPPVAMTTVLCGRSRPGHFQGVATIVTKLLNIVSPNRAYFGQKDGQQLAIVRRLVQDLNLSVEIVGCPIVREASGLAMSSRNQYLTSEQKQEAAILYRSLQQAQKMFAFGERAAKLLTETVKTAVATASAVNLEYVELVHPITLMPLEIIEESGMLAIAARVGTARLIDNVILQDRQPIIAIDGPAGAGKSTVARQVAAHLNLLYLDTGAMYRALTWLVLQLGVPLEDQCAVAELTSNSEIQLVPSPDPDAPQRVWINGQEVTQAIRSIEVTSQVSAVSAQPAVRQALVLQQQLLGKKGGLVAEGRDIGTQVFPDAELKVFLTASVRERARRRQQDFQSQGQYDISLTQLEHDIAERDRKDSTREIAPLQKAADAIEIQTDGQSVEQVIATIVDHYHQRQEQPQL